MGSSYVVSDVHGHLADLRATLAAAGLVDGDDAWTGGDARLWVLGDLVDRGPDGIGVIRFVRALQDQAPGQVQVLMGNHEALMLGEKLFPGTRFDEVWQLNGGLRRDQEGLTDDDVAWLRALPGMARVGDYLLMHSDTTGYLGWGDSVDEVNATLAALLAGDDAQQHFDVFAALTSRYDFAGPDGGDVARGVLDAFGGELPRARAQHHRVPPGQAVTGGHRAAAVRRGPGRGDRRRPVRRRPAAARPARLTAESARTHASNAAQTAQSARTQVWTRSDRRHSRAFAPTRPPGSVRSRRLAGAYILRRTAVTLPRIVACVPSIGS